MVLFPEPETPITTRTDRFVNSISRIMSPGRRLSIVGHAQATPAGIPEAEANPCAQSALAGG
jgi:hypothetical protein